MAKDQLENPPEHADVAPAGEIRIEQRPVLRWFTLAIVIALMLPLIGFLASGVATNRMEFWYLGVGMIVILGIAFAIMLWKIISSRTNPRRP
jgi:hypothetical protein